MAGQEEPRGALAGLNVLELSWVAAGPLSAVLLAYYGATVVKVESAVRIDSARGAPPILDEEMGINRSGYFGGLNIGKLGVALDLNTPRGLELISRLADWADVVVEAFTPGTLARWGLDYESLSRRKPGIVMLSLTLQGQTGPWAFSRGFGLQVQGMSGLAGLIGWPDGPPTGATHAYTDYSVPLWGVFAVMAALDYRDRTGRGQHVDLSQMEIALTMTGPVIPAYVANGTAASRQGNRMMAGDAPSTAPHGVYPVAGDDRWIAIATFSDGEWEALCRVLGREEWLRDERFTTLAGRCQRDVALDALIAAATARFEGMELMARLQAAGVSAGMVHDQRGLFEDPQLAHRGHFVPMVHSDWGEYPGELFGARLSETPPVVQRAAPCLGEHNEYVVKTLLGYSDEEYDALVAAGAVEYYGAD